jgi:predicted lipoprotein with Yx(FWY)xxD motif
MTSHETWRNARASTFAMLVFLALGCAKKDGGTSDSAAGAAAAPSAAAGNTTAGASAAATGNTMAMLDIGKLPSGAEYLTDADGRALYLFEKDKADSSTCTDACAAVWPPVTSNSAPMAHNASVDAAKLGTIARPDGTKQVTYDHKPLYYFAHDQARGDIKGQDIDQFGAEWYLVRPNGRKQEAKK